MDDSACQAFFTQPTQTFHRQYEALRAVFIDGRSQKDVANEFGFSYGAMRQLVLKFRSELDHVDDESPFFEKQLGNMIRQSTSPSQCNRMKRIVDN